MTVQTDIALAAPTQEEALLTSVHLQHKPVGLEHRDSAIVLVLVVVRQETHPPLCRVSPLWSKEG
jgi:hypothetical protein